MDYPEPPRPMFQVVDRRSVEARKKVKKIVPQVAGIYFVWSVDQLTIPQIVGQTAAAPVAGQYVRKVADML
jgi:hypothetical protein